MLNFRRIGQDEFEAYVEYRLLRTSSCDAPCRRQRLQTFGSSKSTTKKQKQIDHDRKIQQTCLKKQLVMLSHGQQLPAECATTFIARPCAIAGPDDLPIGGAKSKVTDFYESRYKKSRVIVTCLPGNWQPESVILEGMFIIQVPPAPGIATLGEYTQMIFRRFIDPHLKAGVTEVHILFDRHIPQKKLRGRRKTRLVTSIHTTAA